MSRDLLFSEYPMFDRIMEERADLCRRVLETALGVPVDEVCNVVAERTVQPRLGSHGVRLDAMVRTKSAVYDVEMQTIARRGIGRRMRYYQGAMDTAMLPPGADYTRLADSYIVFICLQDEFGAGCPVYTLDMACAEDGGVGLGHGFSWVVLNASAWRALPEGGLRGLLRYVATEEVGDDKLAADLAAAVETANEDAAWREEALTMLTIEEDMRAQARFMMEEAREEGLAKGLAEGREKGLAEGLAEGRAEGADKLGALVVQLIDAGRLEDARRAATDAQYREQMIEEFGIG